MYRWHCLVNKDDKDNHTTAAGNEKEPSADCQGEWQDPDNPQQAVQAVRKGLYAVFKANLDQLPSKRKGYLLYGHQKEGRPL